MLHLLRGFWTKATSRRVEPSSGSARRSGLNVEPLETRSMLSAMPLDLDASYILTAGGDADRPTILPEHRPVVINRPILPGGYGKIIIAPTQAGTVIPLWPNVNLPTNAPTENSDGIDVGGFVNNAASYSVNSALEPETRQVQPAFEREVFEVRDLISNLSFVVKEVKAQAVITPKPEVVIQKTEVATPKFEAVTPKFEKAEPLASPVIREKAASKPESAATRAPVTSQPLVHFVDDAEGGMVTLGYHKVADQSAMLTATSAANVESILDREVQFDRAYGTFQAFEVSSGEAPAQSPAPIPGATPPVAKPIGTTSEQIPQPDTEQAKPAIGAISFLPALDALIIDLGASIPSANFGGASVKLDEACVDAAFSMAATEEQYEQSIGNPSLFQLILAIAVATVVHRTQAVRASEPDKTAGGLSASSATKQR
jgi:hypothetical protein